MAMSFPSDPVASSQQQGNLNNNNNNNNDNNSESNSSSSSSSASPTSSSNDHTISMIPSNDQLTGQTQVIPASGPKRKPTRRANTAERRATHNAVERQRRETLNGRFLDLANLLPNLSQIRRPSKSSIVNSSIAHIQASRRHRMIASRELRVLKQESDALRRELNEWRDRAGLPRVEEPTRGDGFGMVLAGELEVISGVTIEEEDEDVDEGLGLGHPMGGLPIHHQPTQQHQQQMASYGGGAYMDEDDDDVLTSYQQQQQQQTVAINPPQVHHAMHHAPQIHPQQQQQNTMIADLEDPRMAAMMQKNVAASNPFAHNSPCYPTVNTRSLYPPNPNTTWAQSPATYATPSHLYTPPASSHGLPTPTLTNGTNSHSRSPVGGLSLNVGVAIAGGSPASTSSSLSGGGGCSPISLVPSHGPLANGRNGCLSTGAGDQSPPYEYHSAQSEYSGGSRSTGLVSASFFVPSQHHQLHGGMSLPQAIGVGGGFHGALMMTI